MALDYWFVAPRPRYGHFLTWKLSKNPVFKSVFRITREHTRYVFIFCQLYPHWVWATWFSYGSGQANSKFSLRSHNIGLLVQKWDFRPKMRKWPYLGSEAINQKNKGTLLSSTLKVEGSKVALDYWFLASRSRYGHFLTWKLPKNPFFKTVFRISPEHSGYVFIFC